MTSSYFYTGIICAVFWGIYFLRKKDTVLSFSKSTLIIFYILTRFVPVAMTQDIPAGTWRNFALEWIIILAGIYYIRKKKSSALTSCICSFYLFQPGIILGILTGNQLFLPAMFVTLAVLCILDTVIKKQGGSLLAFSDEYLLVTIGSLGLFAAVQIYDQHWNNISDAEEIPVLYIVSVTLLIFAIVRCAYRIISKKTFSEHLKPYIVEKTCDCEKRPVLSTRDMVIMICITLAFAVTAFVNLGSVRTPETYRTLNYDVAGNNEIVLGFDSDVYISKIYIYLGYTGKTVMSFSSLEEGSNDWEVFESKHELSSAFCWNEVPVNRSLNRLGMVITEDKEASIHEIVCLDANGNRILPTNASYYKELFDEQGLFPEELRTSYDQTMFDEVYHARTAYEFIHGLSIYENTHPPLGKIIIGLGIRAFGMNPWGWRFMCVIMGTAMIPVIYLLAFAMSASTGTACFTTVLLATEFMHFTLSRIATIDIIVACFVLLMFFFMYCFSRCCGSFRNFNRQVLFLLLCGISTGLAAATKWTGLYATLGIAVLFFVGLFSKVKNIRQEKKYLSVLFACCLACFILIPGCIYLLSYIPFTKVYTDKGLLASAVSNAQLMFTYHSDTVFEHPYSSEWYSWLADIRPLMDSYTTVDAEHLRTIVTFGNPLIWWGGLVALFHQVYLWYYRKCRNARYLVIAYCSVLFPWYFIHRTVFIYQYFLASNILVVMIGNSLHHIKRKKIAMLLFGGISVALFIMFYPVLAGVAVRTDFVKRILQWLPTWTMSF